MKHSAAATVCIFLLSAGCENADPCNGVPTMGICDGTSKMQVCISIEDSNTPPRVETTECKTYEQCQMVSQEARCMLASGRCYPGSSRCDNASRLATCNQQGNWEVADCPSTCREMSVAAFCATDVATTPKTVQLKYEARDINTTTWNSWTDASQEIAPGVLVISRRGNVIIDAAYTDNNGSVTVQVPTTPQTGDVLTAVPARPVTGSSGVGVSFAVVFPNMSAGEQKVDSLTKVNPSFWSWDFDLMQTLPATIVITEAQASGVMRVFDKLRSLMTLAEGAYPAKSSQPLVVWMQPNVTWDCGKCQFDQDILVGSMNFARQIVLGMDVVNQAYWSTAVNSHEFGHYVMSVWGLSPGEAGFHCIGSQYPPGLAWSEGWATWFSSEARRPTGYGQMYYDKQDGAFFSFDIDKREYSGNTPWVRPTAKAGMLQVIDENEVSAMMWNLSSSSLGAATLYNALASKRVTTSPFGRGYKRQTWTVPKGQCNVINLKQSNISIPMLADFLDALVCAGATASIIDGATEPATYYPYPSNSPICQ